MRNVRVFTCLFALATVALVARIIPTTYAGSTAAVTSALAGAPSQAQDPQPQTFSGQIARLEGKYVLKETSTNTTFMLDDQEKAKIYVGKNVKVTGTEDPANKIIHVIDIKEA